MHRSSKKVKFLIIFGFSLIFFGILPQAVQAANLYYSPSSGSYEVSKSVSVSVYVSSQDQAMNAASGIISFPHDKVEVVSLSKSGSIFSLWVQEPSFSNAQGQVNFEGIVLNPGFTGSGGKMLSINFRVKATGQALISFSSGSILANDGKGTNILSSLGTASFSLGGVVITPPSAGEPSLPEVAVLSTPVISSFTHPDSTKWYTEKNAKFSWQVPQGVTGVRLLLGKIPSATPSIVYTPPISVKEILNLKDGTWYFHAQFRNSAGWGSVAHFPFHIDTTTPSKLDIKEIERADKTEPNVKFNFIAEDSASGIDHYEIKIDDNEVKTWRDDGGHIYTTELILYGEHTLNVAVFDAAGNFSSEVVRFNIEPLNSPQITIEDIDLKNNEPLVIRGVTYPNSSVFIWFKKEGQEPQKIKVVTDEGGHFGFDTTTTLNILKSEKLNLNSGVYEVWAETVDARGAHSMPSEKFIVKITRFSFSGIFNWIKNTLTILIPVMALALFLIVLLQKLMHKAHLVKDLKTYREKTKHNPRAVYARLFSMLKDDMEQQLKTLIRASERRKLTPEEVSTVRKLKKYINYIDKYIK